MTIRSNSCVVRSPALEEALENKYQLYEMHMVYLPLAQVYICSLAYDIGIATTNSLNASQSIHDLFFTINVGVQQTYNVLKAVFI